MIKSNLIVLYFNTVVHTYYNVRIHDSPIKIFKILSVQTYKHLKWRYHPAYGKSYLSPNWQSPVLNVPNVSLNPLQTLTVQPVMLGNQ